MKNDLVTATLDYILEKAREGEDALITPAVAKALFKYIATLQAHTIDLLSENKVLRRDLKQTQYLSVLWVRILDSFVPPEKKKDAMQAISAGIAEGMKQAGMEHDADLEQLEQQADTAGA